MRIITSIVVAGIAFHATSLATEIKEQIVTSAELASALGVRPYCADLVLDGASYPRLVAEVKDKDGTIKMHDVTPGGSPNNTYRIRVFLFEDVRTRIPERLIFNLSSDDNVAGNAFIDFPAGSRLARTTTSKTKDWFYEAWVFGPNGPKEDFFRIRLRIETSQTPYPQPPNSSIDPRFEPRQK